MSSYPVFHHQEVHKNKSPNFTRFLANQNDRLTTKRQRILTLQWRRSTQATSDKPTYAYAEDRAANLVCGGTHKLGRDAVHWLVDELVRRKHLERAQQR